MRTFEWPLDESRRDYSPGKKVFFHVHSDGPKHSEVTIKKSDGSEMRLEGDALIAFVADYVRRQRISALIDATDNELLGLLVRS